MIITMTGVAALLLTGGVALAGITAVTTVPEPASLSLMAGGIGIIAVVRYLRRK